jgi:hypothetical protein
MQLNEAISVHPVTAGIFAASSGRLGATVAAVLGLAATVIGGIALARAGGRSRPDAGIDATGPLGGATVAVVVGLIATVLGGGFAATADGGPGTGNGMLGAIVAVVLGLTATILGGLARARRPDVA